MQNNISLWLLFIAVAAICGLFALRMAPALGMLEQRNYLTPNEVRSIAVVYKGIPFTLNFEQQNELIGYLNGAVPAEKSLSQENDIPSPISKITIYRFNQTEIELEPLFYRKKELVFRAPTWRWEGSLQETSKGKLQKLLSNAVDE